MKKDIISPKQGEFCINLEKNQHGNFEEFSKFSTTEFFQNGKFYRQMMDLKYLVGPPRPISKIRIRTLGPKTDSRQLSNFLSET